MQALSPSSQRAVRHAVVVPSKPAVPRPRRQLRTANVLPISTIAEAMPMAEQATYVGLGLTAVSFLGTFVVVPAFKEYFKEPIDWKDMYRELSSFGVKSITPEEAYAKSKKGSVLVDVRLPAKYEEQHPAGSKGVPLYLPIQKWDVPSIMRRAGFAFFGIYGTELNTAFADQMLLNIPRSKEVMVICESGGSLENKSGTQFGFQSRSLKAVYYLRKAGYSKVLHVAGGTSRWNREDLPVEEGAAGAVALVSAALDDGSKKEGSGSVGTKATSGTRGTGGVKTKSGSSGTKVATSGKSSGGSKFRFPELPSIPLLQEKVPVGTRSLRKMK